MLHLEGSIHKVLYANELPNYRIQLLERSYAPLGCTNIDLKQIISYARDIHGSAHEQ